MARVNRWANFLKHPKAFFLVHHPEFSIEEPATRASTTVFIDQEFIDKYYAGDGQNEELTRRLQNRAEVIVIIPSLPALLLEFSEELNIFMKIIRENPIYKELLGNKSTYEKFFEKYPIKEG